MKESTLFKRLVAAFVVIVIGDPAVVLADTLSYFVKGPKTNVSDADLNLESEEGVRVLYRRLQHASREVCSTASPKIGESVIMNWGRRLGTRRCSRRTLSNAVDQFHNEDLTRIHAG